MLALPRVLPFFIPSVLPPASLLSTLPLPPSFLPFLFLLPRPALLFLTLSLAPAVPSEFPPAPRRRTVASTNDSPISQPTGAAVASTNESTSKARLYVDRPAKPGTKLIATAGTKALPAQTSNSTIFTNNSTPTTPRFNARTSLSCRSSSRMLNPSGIARQSKSRKPNLHRSAPIL